MALLTISAQQAQQAVRANAEAMRRDRRIPVIAKNIVDFSDQTCVWLFNVGPWGERRMLGSWGEALIPARPKDKPCATVLFNGGAVPGVYHETIPQDGSFSHEVIQGQYIAQEILGEGEMLRSVNPNESRRKIGVFIGSVLGPKGSVPLASELEEAREALSAHMRELITEANGWYGAGTPEAHMNISSRHKLAAALSGEVGLPWMKEQMPEKRVQCDGCGEWGSAVAALCKCGAVLNVKKYNYMVAAGTLPGRVAIVVPDIRPDIRPDIPMNLVPDKDRVKPGTAR